MNNDRKKPDFKQSDLPQSEVFDKKEVYQHPQPADQGLPLNRGNKKDARESVDNEKEENQTSKDEGLNEEKSAGNAGAFEGFEDQSS